ncbi:MAG: BlaI/MecI/CopY family transcriptional regulator [Muribaculaceae bacterium]|nr:BlaI/MecI/CopY family transcriptional regulator [Muribaculaceae bacterium]
MTRPKNKYPRLTERESEIMKRLWEHGPLFVRELVALYPDPRPHVNTVSTTVRILEDKGYVSHEAVGASFRYYAVAQPEDFAGRSLSEVIRNYFRGSASAAVSALVDEERITVDELREIIDMVERRKNEEEAL